MSPEAIRHYEFTTSSDVYVFFTEKFHKN